MKVLAITALYPPHHLGGYDLRCREVLYQLQSRGHDIRVLTSMYGADGQQVDGNVFRVLHLEPSETLLQRIIWDVKDLKFIKRQIESFQPDVIHLFHMAQLARTIFPFLSKQSTPLVYDEGGIGLILAWRSHGRWLGFCQGESSTVIKKLLKRAFCRTVYFLSGGVLPIRWMWPDNMQIYYNSVYTRERHRKAGVPVDGCEVIHAGIDLRKFQFRERRQAGSVVRLLAPGRIHPEKGVIDAVEALGILSREDPAHEVHLDIAGPVQDTDYRNELIKRAKGLGLERYVHFLGMLPYKKMVEAYQSADICMLLTRIPESFSRVPLEAMACGAAVITTATGGISELIRESKSCLIVTIASPPAVANAVRTLLDDQDLYHRVVNNARRDVEENYSLTKSVDRIEQLLLNAADRRVVSRLFSPS